MLTIISFLTFVLTSYILYKVTLINRKYTTKLYSNYIRHRQSTIHVLVKGYMPTNEQVRELIRQSQDMISQSSKTRNSKIRVVVVGKTAYWVKENRLFRSELTEDGDVDLDSATPVVTENMSQEEIIELMQIVDDLRGDNNDGFSTGN